MYRLAHLSDIHFGRIAHPAIVEAIVADVNARGVDLVVASGDLTQRAQPHEFAAARAMLDAFDAPTLVVPGNHDVFAWWHRPVTRVFDPLQRYRTLITDDLTPTFEADGLAVLGINSAYGRTVKGGRIGRQARAAIGQFFGAQPPSAFKVLVLHHHLTRLRALGRHDIARYARQTLDAAVDAGVDLILCGHLHVSHIEPVEIIPAAHRLVIASAGTATSSRGRGTNRNTNFYNYITVEDGDFHIEEFQFDPAAVRFNSVAVTRFPR